jgi:hypothetical protein
MDTQPAEVSEVVEDDYTIDDEEFNRLKEERQREVDLLSLELLSNTKQYRKFISRNCPEEKIRRAEETCRFLRYKTRILKTFTKLLDEYEEEFANETTIPSELQEICERFIQKTIQNLEWNDWNKKTNESSQYDDDTDEDMMFPDKPPSKKKKSSVQNDDPYSFWGIKIKKS